MAERLQTDVSGGPMTFLVAATLRANYSRPINLGNPEEYSMNELADIVRELTGSRSPIAYEELPKDDPRRRRPDITLAKSLLDWTPHASLREGLAATIRYFRGLLGLEASDPAPAGRRRDSAPSPATARHNGLAGPWTANLRPSRP